MPHTLTPTPTSRYTRELAVDVVQALQEINYVLGAAEGKTESTRLRAFAEAHGISQDVLQLLERLDPEV
jgi:hypothetical protein